MTTRIVRDCDQHVQDGQFVSAEEWEVTLSAPGEKPVTYKVDLCQECEKPLVQLGELFNDIARSTTPKKKSWSTAETESVVTTSEGELACPVCVKPFTTRSALGSHTRRVHGKVLADLTGEPIKFICMRCDDHPGFTSGTGFSAHRRATHDISKGPFLEGENPSGLASTIG